MPTGVGAWTHGTVVLVVVPVVRLALCACFLLHLDCTEHRHTALTITLLYCGYWPL
jgi:hypothetical protein